MTPGSTKPSSALKSAITKSFGSEKTLQDRLTGAGAKLAGSGWGALVWEPIAQQLQVVQLHDHQNDFIVGATPLLVIDGWEHAYYLDYRSDRQTWANKFFEVADWASTSARFEALTDTSGI